MDHSVESYLRRCSTEKLYQIIVEYLNQKEFASGEEVIFEVLDVLWKRNALFPDGIPIALVLQWEERHFL